ncbi:MFS transporter [Arthrobacter glacialis]|uniref:MFS transporter n=1 Tax=Arthrobacter glacialis TaxID=1664 RepID=A0A2S4A1R9_ARTGL|nr:MFS transporter [Arthrobacter glacialis]POH60978.1 MFS transporter [Arthrobacter glacialis]POH75077.1 MFS transporter [Arthrobacter glacialis]
MTPPSAHQNAALTAPINLVTTRPPWSQTFSSLKIRNYRIFASANLLAVIAVWMQRVAQDWMVLELSGSVTAVGITVFMQFIPSLLLMPLGGILADRYSKRLILIISQSAAGILATLMAVLALTGRLEVWHIYVIAFVLGLVVVADQPARQVFVNELVGPRQLRNAISLNSSIFQMGGMIGPAVSGVLIMAVGGGWAFAVNALACAVTVISLTMIRTHELVKMPPVKRGKGQLMEGVRYALRKPTIVFPAAMAAVFAVFGLSLAVLMAAYANTVFDAGAGGYGLLNTLVALGALGGALASTRFATLRLRGVMSAAGAYGVVLMLAAFAPSMATFGAVMVVAGFASLLFLTSANQLVQMSTNVLIRGRVMSLYIMVLIGGQALGGPLMGWLAEHWGVQWAMLLAGGVTVLAAAVIALVLAKRGQLALKVNLRSPRQLVFIVPKAG